MSMMPPSGAAGSGSGAMSGAAGAAAPAVPPPQTPSDQGRAECVVASEAISGRALHFVVDESLAMVFPRDMWTPLGRALDGFVASERAASLSLGMEFFQGECDPRAYAQPDVPIAKVGELTAVAERMDDRPHGIGAATTLALTAGLEAAHQFGAAHAARGAVVLISGSEPDACGGSAESAAEAAAAALAFDRPLPTYVLALRDLDSLQQIAQAGGTQGAVTLDGAVTEDALTSGLDAIATRASCEYVLPEAARAYVPDRINVKLTEGGTATVLPSVGDAGSCDPERGGFYFDDPENPGRIVLCGSSCDRVLRGGRVDLEYGCPTATL